MNSLQRLPPLCWLIKAGNRIRTVDVSSIARNRARRDLPTLPVELWEIIFEFASSIPGKEEFTTDISAYGMVLKDDSEHPFIPSFEEQTKMIKVRLNIVRVCRHWHSIGLPILWSHLRIDFGKPTCTTAMMHRIHQTLRSNPELTSYVIRLSAVNSRKSLPHSTVKYPELFASAQAILQLFSSLRILECPAILGVAEYRCQPTIVILNSSYMRYDSIPSPCLTPQKPFLLNIRVLELTYNLEFFTPRQGLHFPVLDTLRINHQRGEYTQDILGRFTMPVLRTLSIRSASMWSASRITRSLELENFLIAKGHGLERLEIHLSGGGPKQRIELPRLKVLIVAMSSYWWSHRINAPELRHLGFFYFPHVDAGLNFGLNTTIAINAFPLLNKLVLYTLGGLSILWPEQPDAYLKAWCESGIHVVIRIL